MGNWLYFGGYTMNRIQKSLFITFFLFLCGFLLTLSFFKQNISAAPNHLILSRIVSEVSTHWPNVENGNYSDYPYSFSAVDPYGRLLYQSAANTATNQLEALKRQDSILNISKNGTIVGTLYVSTNFEQTLQFQRKQYAQILLFSFTFLALSFFLSFLYLEHSIVHPFQRLKDFAKQIAYGNLDIPLFMEKNNLFGSFTEAFDLMRTKLLESREQTRLANQSKKELVASLSHDIKTPVTSIKLLSELMLVTEHKKEDMERLHTIYTKAEQIDRLITDLFQSSLEELGELNVTPIVMESTKLISIIKSSDYNAKVTFCKIQECFIFADPLRLEQVIGNLIVNSYKYAGTQIEIHSELIHSFLKVTIRDYGLGVSEDDLPLLTTKFYRGKNAFETGKNGSGLGLYISGKMMEKMDGDLICRNLLDGFLVELYFALV